MTQEKSAKEIAKELHISFRTVEYYFDKTRKRFGYRSNKKLIAFYGLRIPVKMITDSDFHLISDSGVFDHPVDSRWHYL